MIDIEKLKPLIVEKLKPLNLEKIILFGSYAYGTPYEESDLDLYIVTSDNVMPKSWKEKNTFYLKVSQQLNDIMEQYPTDLIVHTKQMHKKFLQLDSMFSRKVMQKGISLL